MFCKIVNPFNCYGRVPRYSIILPDTKPAQLCKKTTPSRPTMDGYVLGGGIFNMDDDEDGNQHSSANHHCANMISNSIPAEASQKEAMSTRPDELSSGGKGHRSLTRESGSAHRVTGDCIVFSDIEAASCSAGGFSGALSDAVKITIQRAEELKVRVALELRQRGDISPTEFPPFAVHLCSMLHQLPCSRILEPS